MILFRNARGLLMRTFGVFIPQIFLISVFVLMGHGPNAKAGIGDIISDFLYYEEELKIKNPANPVADVLDGLGGRYLALVDTSGTVRVWDFETGRENAVEEPWPTRVKAVFPNTRGANFIIADKDGRIYETTGLSFTAKTTLLETGKGTDRVAVSSQGSIIVGAAGLQLHVYNLGTRQAKSFPVKTFPAQGLITSLTVSPDGRYIAYQTEDSLSVLDTDRRRSFPVKFIPDVDRLEFFYDPDGNLGLAQFETGGRLSFHGFDGRAFVEMGTRDLGVGAKKIWIRNRNEFYWAENKILYRGSMDADQNTVIYQSKEAIAHIKIIGATGALLILQKNSIFRIYS